jgi:pilus assembly protein Flp/PilA
MRPQLKRFLRRDDGAQVVEYALIIAVVSIALVLALQPVLISGDIGNFIGRLSNCLNGNGCS